MEGGSKREEGGRPGGVSTNIAADALRHLGRLVVLFLERRERRRVKGRDEG